MLVDSFSNRLQIALNRNNMRPIDLANKSHIDRSSISRYLSGDWKASQKRLTLLAMALNTNEAWLMGYDVSDAPNKTHINYKEFEEAKIKTASMSIDEKRKSLKDYMIKSDIDKLFFIPLYSAINKDLESSKDKLEGYTPLNPILYNMKNPDDYFYVKMQDSSMNMKYQKGDYILMKKDNQIKDNIIALLVIDSTTLIRKINIQENLILLEALSNDNFKTIATSKDKIKIIGSAIGYLGYERSN